MSRTVTVAVQVLPLCDDPFPVIDRAIAAIQGSDIKHEVGPMETTMEGELGELLEIARRAHEACFVEGVERVVTIIKIGDARGGSTIEDKVGKFRNESLR